MAVEMEDFEITDYDLQNEFNPNRKTFRLTKEQQVYGIWAQNSGSEDDERPSTSSRRTGKPQRKDYTTPIDFIGGEIQQAGKKTIKLNKDEDEESDDGTKFRSLMPGRGKQKQAHAQHAKNSEGNFGDWERHTTGIGGKLLLKMGYKPGGGLGKNLQGIEAPILTKKREGRGAIGRYGSEHVKPPLEELKKAAQKPAAQWKKKVEEGKNKVEYVYESVDEVIAEGSHRKFVGGDSSQLSKVKVIDMTGPEQKVLSGYAAIHQQHSRPQDVEDTSNLSLHKRYFELPELQHNLDLLVDMNKDEIIRNNREQNQMQDRIALLQNETEKCMKLDIKEKAQIENLARIIEMIDRLDVKTDYDSNPTALEDFANEFRYLRKNMYEEYMMYELASVAVSLIQPELKRQFAGWNPSETPYFGTDVMKIWRELLEEDSRNSLSKDGTIIDPYHRLLWETWMPRIRMAVANWNCRDYDSIIEVLNFWRPLIPLWIFENILDQLVLPRLQEAVELWNPLTDTIPIHAWIHPWLPTLGNRLHAVYPTIRNKLSNALTKWHPSDPSAKLILEPWSQAFEPGVMDMFLVKNIVPKLAICLQDFIINPHQQQLDAWDWVMDWNGIIAVPIMANTLDKNFFPKWIQVLCTWLSHSPNFDEINQWFSGWKNLVPKTIQQQPAIQKHFQTALDIMNRAAANMMLPASTRDHLTYLTSTERQTSSPEVDQSAYQQQQRSNYQTMSAMMLRADTGPTSQQQMLKQIVETKAAEMGILFMPVANRFHEARQVYSFGKIPMCLDKSLIFAQINTVWMPVSIQTLCDAAR